MFDEQSNYELQSRINLLLADVITAVGESVEKITALERAEATPKLEKGAVADGVIQVMSEKERALDSAVR